MKMPGSASFRVLFFVVIALMVTNLNIVRADSIDFAYYWGAVKESGGEEINHGWWIAYSEYGREHASDDIDRHWFDKPEVTLIEELDDFLIARIDLMLDEAKGELIPLSALLFKIDQSHIMYFGNFCFYCEPGEREELLNPALRAPRHFRPGEGWSLDVDRVESQHRIIHHTSFAYLGKNVDVPSIALPDNQDDMQGLALIFTGEREELMEHDTMIQKLSFNKLLTLAPGKGSVWEISHESEWFDNHQQRTWTHVRDEIFQWGTGGYDEEGFPYDLDIESIREALNNLNLADDFTDVKKTGRRGAVVIPMF